MKYKVLTIALLVAFGARTAKADLNVDISLTLALSSGADVLGLAGATVDFDATFADGTVYGGTPAFPDALATSHSLTISGASNPASNGMFSDPDGFLYSPNASTSLFLDSLINFYRTPAIFSGESFQFGLDLDAPPVLGVPGGFVESNHFATSTSGFSAFESVAFDGQFPPTATYSIVGGTSGITTSFVGSTDPSAAADPALQVNTPTLAFGNTRLGTSATLSAEIENAGDAGSTMSGDFAATSGEFTPGATQAYGPLAQNATATRNYTYTPTDRTADSLIIDHSNSSVVPIELVAMSLTGDGVGPEFGTDLTGITIDFGTVPADSFFDITFNISNDTTDTGIVPIELVQLSLQSVEPITVEFSVDPLLDNVLDPAESTPVTVNFDTTGLAPGPYSDILTIETDQLAAFGDLVNGAAFNFTLQGFVSGGGPAATPEPSAFALSALGLLSLGFIGWRRRRR